MSALCSMANLISFKAYTPSFQTTRSLADEVAGHCTFPHLQRLRWTCFRNKGRLCQFLQRHPNLRVLIITWPPYYPEILLSSEAIPNLEYVEGMTGEVEAFLPKRNIQRLSWRSDSDPFVHPSLSPEVHHALCNLRQLALRGGHWDEVLPGLVKDLQDLEVLQIEWLANWKMDSLVSTIKALSCLRSMIFTDHERVGDPHLFAFNIFQSCHPKLKHVYIDDGTKQQTYNRFSLTPNRLVVESIRVRVERHWMEVGVIESAGS
ncbi:hypothetical protein BDN72DRAFT_522551 [Pluteus cervinus]|uniref:Uncharacterized protein n=1 Tax=Pluteus cervinus TaxID=181527 RepID=A0ACD3AYG7_9AGAR|nr:hypothetical protein BDN72DRAFT_522551 [Pluteus cervinus]